MNAPDHDRPASLFMAQTHEVHNIGSELVDINLFATDRPLQEAVAREGAAWAAADLHAFGARIGTAEHLALGHLANRHGPELDTHDRFGRRIDQVNFHPAYHALMRTSIEQGLHCSPWFDARPGAHVARAAGFYLHSQVDAGHGCPISMTFAAVPALRSTPGFTEAWLQKIAARQYDPRNVPDGQKQAVTIGMAMTEKQGGSDVRANTTRAHPAGAAEGPGAAYALVGHKFFVSAPMCDGFLVLAQAPGGLSCFLLPRWQPDGRKNPLEVLRLKRKMGNVSNASSETELRGALAWMLGDEGRGVRTIIEMVAMTRFDCMIGSSAIQRAALAPALHHAQQRAVFGKRLIDQPLMRNVLADLALEVEASLALTLRIGRAMDQRAADPHEDAIARLVTAVGKYWVCKRTPQVAVEAMECIGGSGVMEDSPFPRHHREAPVNAIWEGSGNVQCLDVLRALQKSPEVLPAFLAELHAARGGHRAYDTALASLQADLAQLPAEPEALEFSARHLVDRMACLVQAAQLLRHAPAAVADGFCASRLGAQGQHQFGALPRGVDVGAVLARAMPVA